MRQHKYSQRLEGEREALVKEMSSGSSEKRTTWFNCIFDYGDPLRELLSTDFWLWQKELEKEAKSPLLVFSSDPPVGKAKASDRILVVGSDKEVGDFNSLLLFPSSSEEYQSARKKIRHTLNRKNFEKVVEKILQVKMEYRSSSYCFVSSMEQFWGTFFGEALFLDFPVSIPRLIMTTGQINGNSNVVWPVALRLEEIAKGWYIPLVRVPIWDK